MVMLRLQVSDVLVAHSDLRMSLEEELLIVPYPLKHLPREKERGGERDSTQLAESEVLPVMSSHEHIVINDPHRP